MSTFDKRLLAVADCSVIPHRRSPMDEGPAGGIVFDPYPAITATGDEVLSHELCHRLAGKTEYDMFLTATVAKEGNPLYKFVLNLLTDWYHECLHENYSPFLRKKVEDLHVLASKIEPDKKLKSSKIISYLIQNLYLDREETPESAGINDYHSVIFLADRLYDSIENKKKLTKLVAAYLSKLNMEGITGAGSSSYGQLPEKSNFYIKTVAKYAATIKELERMWTRNKYDWVQKHFGEIDWKNLIGMYTGEKLMWPVFLIMQKIILKKRVYLCIDRSGSTGTNLSGTDIPLSILIMELAVIIAESIRLCNAPISILDVGVQNKIINSIDEPIDTTWFHPMAKFGTPLGEVCGKIREKGRDSLLIIITDGVPNSFSELSAAIQRFPGDTVTFVIGDDYSEYSSIIPNTVAAQPHTIIHDLKRHVERGIKI